MDIISCLGDIAKCLGFLFFDTPRLQDNLLVWCMFVVIWLLMTCPIDTCPGAAGRVIENDNWITWTVETALVHSAATYCIHHHQLLWNCLSFRIIDYWLPPGSRAHNTLTVALSVYHRISEFVNIQEKYKVLITSTGTVACFNPVEKREARLAAWKITAEQNVVAPAGYE